MRADVDFEIPADLAAYLAELDEFIELQIRPLEQQDDNARLTGLTLQPARLGNPAHRCDRL
jgi:acyl-CoA dehydrogenase